MPDRSQPCSWSTARRRPASSIRSTRSPERSRRAIVCHGRRHVFLRRHSHRHGRAGIDVMVSSSNKCIEGVPGFSYVLAAADMLEASQGHCHSTVLDLYEQWAVPGEDRTVPLHAADPCACRLPSGAEGTREGRRHRRARPPAMHAMPTLLLAGMRRDGLPDPARTTKTPGRSSRPSSRRATPISTSSKFYEAAQGRGYAIYPGKLTKRPSFRIGTIGQIDETVMQAMSLRFAKCCGK